MEEHQHQHRAFTEARLILVLLFVVVWLALFPVGFAMPYGFLFVLLTEASALLGYLWLVGRARHLHTLERLHKLLLVLELGFHSAMVYFLGGVGWLGPVAYVYALMYTSIFLSWRGAAVFAAAVAASFMLVISVDGAGLVPHQWYLPQGPERYQDPAYLVPTAVGFVGVLGTVTFWMAFIGSEMRRERDVALRANARLLMAQEDQRRLNEELEQKVEERTRALLRRAEIDQLTGLLNRGAVTGRCREMLLLARRGKRPLAVVVADADDFKSCNDLGGHQYGDRVLQALARVLEGGCRGSDIVGRMGGDEFLIILPDTSVRGALHFYRRVARRLEEWRTTEPSNGLPVPLLSFGVAVFPDHGSDMDDIIRVADRAMYDAKAGGGGRLSLGACGATFEARAAERQAEVEA